MVAFDDFLDMMIVMHPKTKRHIKLAYMFAIYDFDNDGVLNHADLMHVIHRITGGALRIGSIFTCFSITPVYSSNLTFAS